MKKHILIFLLFTGFLQAQTYPVNPTKFGKISLNTNVEDNTAGKISVQSATNEINWLLPENIPINQPPHPINYTATTPTLGAHLIGIDTRLGTIVQTTAGTTARVFFTGETSVVNSVTYYNSSLTGKGSIASVNQTVVNPDDTRTYFAQDVISVAQVATTISASGTYAGQLTVRVSDDSAQEKFGFEVYKTNSLGVPIASDITGAPVGSLGVTVVAVLDSGVIDLVQNSTTNVSVSGLLASPLTLNAGERIRYHAFAEKVGTSGASFTYTLYYGSDNNSYYDVPVTPTTDTVINKSLVSGTTTSDALNTLNTADGQNMKLTGDQTFSGLKTGTATSSATATTGFQFENNYNGGVGNIFNAPIQVFNNQFGIGIGAVNVGNGWLYSGANTTTGTIFNFNTGVGATGDQIAHNVDNIKVGGVDYLGRASYPSATLGTSSNTSVPQLIVKNGSNPSVIEFPKTGFTIKGTVGALGSYEMNMSTNMDYTTSPGIHRFYDNTLDATWLAIGDSFWQMQYAPKSVAAGDVWNNAGQPRPFYQRTDTGLTRINTTVALSGVGTIGDAMFAVRRNAGFASIAGEIDLAIEGHKTKGTTGNVFINTYNAGNVSLVAGGGTVIVGTTPTTSAGTYDILTRNTSSGVVEKVASSALPTSGTYTPVSSLLVNSSSPAMNVSTYSQVGNVVTAVISFGVTTTVLNTASSITITLPVARSISSLKYIGSGVLFNASVPASYLPVSVSTIATTTCKVDFTSPLAGTQVLNGTITIQYLTN